MKNPVPVPLEGRVIVLDTAALIAGTDSLYALGGLSDARTGTALVPPAPKEQVTFYTVPDVIKEVRDRRARARLALLDGAVVVRAPSSDAVAAVINFAKATGDFSVLSLADIRVMALCWMLELERNGGHFLNSAPKRTFVGHVKVGKLIPFDEVDRREREADETDDGKSKHENDWEVVRGKACEQLSVTNDSAQAREGGNKTESESLKTRRRRRRRKKSSAAQERGDLPDTTVCVEPLVQEASAGGDGSSIPTIDDRELEQNVSNDTAGDGEDQDNVGWINEENVAEYLARDGCEEEQTGEEQDRIGCVTTDFAMQNTMLQMGLKLLSVDGRRTIRKIKHFALRCHSCGTVTTELDKLFCERCGNASMHRVAFKIDKKGVARSYLNPKKQPNLRGTKYPIPMPRGGRNNRDIILCEDQIDPVKQKRLQKQRERLNVDVLDPSNFYNAGARFDPNNRTLVVGYGRRNPNEVGCTSRKR